MTEYIKCLLGVQYCAEHSGKKRKENMWSQPSRSYNLSEERPLLFRRLLENEGILEIKAWLYGNKKIGIESLEWTRVVRRFDSNHKSNL